MKRCLLFVLAVLACLLLAGCNTTVPDVPETDPPAPETTAPPEVPPLRLVGGENAYTVICDDEMGKDAANACAKLRAAISPDLSLTDDWADRDETPVFSTYEILLGNTNRPESAQLAEGLGVSDYRIAVVGEKLVAVGGSDTALIHAVKRLMSDVTDGELPRDYSVFFDGAEERDEYIADPDKFLCSWVMEFDVPEWLRDFEEKKAAFADPDGRMISCFHRGDGEYYPENSIEGIISAVQMGADNLELDLRLTKDGVVVLMHDATLNRTTDFVRKKGKDGLPSSNKVEDWTFEQLRQLRLAYKGRITDYLIPTFEEALTVCRGRTTIRLDKHDVWDWDTDVYPLIKKTEAWDTCIINYHYSLEKQQRILGEIQADSGVDALIFYKYRHQDRKKWVKTYESLLDEPLTYVARWTSFETDNMKKSVEEAAEPLAALKDHVRFYVDAHTLAGAMETVEEWDFLYENGVDMILVDNGLPLVKYIAENFEPTEY